VENSEAGLRKRRARLTRRAFHALPLSERRRILAQQAEALTAHYATSGEWRETEVQDLREF
jgi:hypothetical protein